MKKLALALAATAAFTGQVSAADMAVKARPVAPPPVAVANWTGCYIGGGGGYGLFAADHDQIAITTPQLAGNTFAVGTLTSVNQTAGGRGYLGIVGGGCDYQFGGGFLGGGLVIGAFADYQWSDIHGQTTSAAFNFNDGSAVGLVGTLRQRDTWAVGGRVGFVATPQLMTYITGGYTEARFDSVNFTAAYTPFIGQGNGLNLPGQTYSGYFVGGGTEYALGFLPGLFLKTEYRYSSFDSKTIGTNCLAVSAPAAGLRLPCPAIGPSGFADRYRPHTQSIFTELVYRFNWGGGGVVAKY